MPERNLDLLKRGVALVSELGKGAPEIMRRNLHANALAMPLDHLEHRLGGHPFPHDATALIDRAQRRRWYDQRRNGQT